MLVLKNKNFTTDNVLSTETLDLGQEFELFINSLNVINIIDLQHERDPYVLAFIGLFNCLCRDNCYYAQAFLNDFDGIDDFMELYNEFYIIPVVRDLYRDKKIREYCLSKIEIIKDAMVDSSLRMYKKNFINFLETICLKIQERIRYQEVMTYPVSLEWNNTVVTLGYTTSTPAYNRAVIPTPESLSDFVNTYYRGEYGETAPANLLTYALQELPNIGYGEDPNEVVKRVMGKTLETIELDKFDPVKSMYYIGIDHEAFSKDLYFLILHLMQYMHNYASTLHLNDVQYFISNITDKVITISYRES